VPLYDFRCESGHWTEVFRHASGRDNAPDCAECGEATVRGIHGRKGSELADEKASERRERRELNAVSTAIRDLICDCGHVEDTVIVERVDGEFPTGAPCPACGADAPYRIPPEIRHRKDVLLAKFGHHAGDFDFGAGQRFHSKEERRAWMKERNVVEVGDMSDQSIDDWERGVRDFDEKTTREWGEYTDRLDNAPEFSEFRKARDQGRIASTRS